MNTVVEYRKLSKVMKDSLPHLTRFPTDYWEHGLDINSPSNSNMDLQCKMDGSNSQNMMLWNQRKFLHYNCVSRLQLKFSIKSIKLYFPLKDKSRSVVTVYKWECSLTEGFWCLWFGWHIFPGTREEGD